MPLKIYSTLSRKKESFKPLKGKKVNLFVCGPTVYDYSHLGHAKTYVQFDMIAKSLKFLGYNVFYLQNITDIDDKIINRANEQEIQWKDLAAKYREYYFEDMVSLGVDSISKYANATDYMNEIVSQVKRLLEKGYAYKISDGYYFDLKKDKDYGKLARRTALGNDDSVSRVDENDEKRNSGDFCLWKFKKNNEPSWKTEIGEGRPGWHIEDTAITEKEFGPQYDIHGGATDLIFPHHEAEIAQMESLSGKVPLVKYWMHTGFLKINKEKMSKSLGNFSTIRDILKNYPSGVLRYLFASGHYRKPLDFSKKSLDNAKNSYERLQNICENLKDDGKENKVYLKEFEESINNDINLPEALQVMWKILRDEGAEGKYGVLRKMDEIFGFKLFEREKIKIPSEVKSLLKKREKARNEKNWKESDSLRDEMKELGFLVLDGKDGQEIKKV